MPKRILQGVVVGDKADKTITVNVERRVTHKVYKKIIKVSKKYSAHDATNKFKIGDVVKIVESKPYSKTKKWEVLDEEAAA
jgi:small subunit ribosomal protein S17